MEDLKLQEILRSIIRAVLGASINSDGPLASQLSDTEWSRILSRALNVELGVTVSSEEIKSSGSLPQLSKIVGNRAPKNPKTQSIVDIYVKLEQLVREELNPNIFYHWHAHWTDFQDAGNWLTRPDGLDYVEIVLRVEEEFGFSIPDRDAQAMQTVGQTVRYLWQRICTQDFALRQRAEGVCQTAFIFHELRRLLMVRGGVPRHAVRLDARLCDLLPSWSTQFWKHAQDIFQVDLPQSHLLAFNWGIEKRTTVKELVSLIASSQAPESSH